jgi:dihydrofolate reductase
VAGLVLVRRYQSSVLEIVYYVASSLDGYIATENGGVDWLSSGHVPGEDNGAAEFEASADALLLGSHTYEFPLRLGHWPSPKKPSWVFTQRDLRVLHPSITLTSQSPTQLVASLASRGFRRAWLMGRGKLAASFQAEQLISRYMILVFPVLLGSGIRLFAPHSARPDTLRFIGAKPFTGGIVQLTYDRAQNA